MGYGLVGFGLDLRPDFPCPIFQDQRLLPTIDKLIALSTGDPLRRRPQLAQEI